MPGSDQTKTASGLPVGTVTNVQRFSLHDGGGIRTVGFLKGCPFRCPWCCNPENLSFVPEVSWKSRLCIHCSMAEGGDGLRDCPRTPEQCPTGAKELMGRERNVTEFAQDLLRDMPFFEESGGGITLSGGECLAGRNLSFALAVLEECHRHGANTAVETTLAVPLGGNVERLVAAVDTFLVDFKIADRTRSMECAMPTCARCWPWAAMLSPACPSFPALRTRRTTWPRTWRASASLALRGRMSCPFTSWVRPNTIPWTRTTACEACAS